MDKLNNAFQEIFRIIERESKTSTYKFALLRGTIDIIQESSPYINIKDDMAYLPMGLLVEKWLIYYYPIFESEIIIPQIHGSSISLAFGPVLLKVIDYYKHRGGFSVFYNDLHNKGLPTELLPDFRLLVKYLCYTITRMPMKYIGTSVNNEYYSIYKYQVANSSKWTGRITSATLIKNLGTFSIPVEYYEVFKLLGSFLNGQESILLKWAEFSVKASNNTISLKSVLNEVLRNPVTEREAKEVVKIYRQILETEGNVQCVWTGSKLKMYDIDHMIPFSIWKNNDLWNLLPSSAKTNNSKRDKIPSPDLIYKRQESIIHYWEILNLKLPERFQREFRISLIGETNTINWQHAGIKSLQHRCNYLITERGYEQWNSQ